MLDPETLRDSSLWLWLADRQAWIGPVVCVIAFVESFAIAGVVVPGVALLAITAFAAGSTGTELGATLAWAFAGAVAGDGTSYLLGRFLGPTVRERRPLRSHPEWIERGEAFFRRHGVLGVVLGRFVGPIRPVMPLIAGTLRMPAPRFFTVNLLSALGWAPAYVLPGYLVGASLSEAVATPPHLLPGLVVAAAALWALFRGAGTAWRSGARDGALARRLEGGPVGAWWLRPLTPTAGSDTRLSLLAATATLLAGVALLAVMLATVPALEPWRVFAADLLRIVGHLS
jgi:undecaprenyl-diphosphatase